MKKKFYSPEVHLVKLENLEQGTDLSQLSDRELLELMERSNYEKNKTCYQASSKYMSREIAGEVVLVPVEDQSLNGMVTFNETGTYLWKLLEIKRTEADLVYGLSKKYHQPSDVVESDVKAFLEGAVQRGFVVAC